MLKIAKGDEASKGHRALTQHLQWDHAVVSSPVLYGQKQSKEDHKNCKQEDDSPIGPGVFSSRPLQAKYQAQIHRHVYGEACPVYAPQPIFSILAIFAAERCVLGSTYMADAKEYYNKYDRA